MTDTTVTGVRDGVQSVTDETALAVSGLTKSYPVKRNLLGRVVQSVDAVQGVSFEVRRGETLALVGESGAGKSTVGRLALRLIEPTSGSIKVLGDDITTMGASDLRKVRTRATMIFQDPYKSLNPRAQIRYSIAEPMLSQGIQCVRSRRACSEAAGPGRPDVGASQPLSVRDVRWPTATCRHCPCSRDRSRDSGV